jgi:hypothetical protein
VRSGGSWVRMDNSFAQESTSPKQEEEWALEVPDDSCCAKGVGSESPGLKECFELRIGSRTRFEAHHGLHATAHCTGTASGGAELGEQAVGIHASESTRQ